MKKLFLSSFLLLGLLLSPVGFGYSTQNAQAILYFNKGVQYAKNQDYNNAVEYFTRATEADPTLVEAYYNLASIYLYQKQIDDVYDCYTSIIKYEPRNYSVLYEMAKIQYNKKNYSHCVKLLNNIPEGTRNYEKVAQLKRDAMSFFNEQKEVIQRTKATEANVHDRTILDNFNAPAGVAADSKGYIYVVSYTDNSILRISPKDKTTHIFQQDGYLRGPIGLAIDRLDNVYVANYDGNNILKITPSGRSSIFMDNISQPYFLNIVNDVLYVTGQGDGIVMIYNLADN